MIDDIIGMIFPVALGRHGRQSFGRHWDTTVMNWSHTEEYFTVKGYLEYKFQNNIMLGFWHTEIDSGMLL